MSGIAMMPHYLTDMTTRPSAVQVTDSPYPSRATKHTERLELPRPMSIPSVSTTKLRLNSFHWKPQEFVQKDKPLTLFCPGNAALTVVLQSIQTVVISVADLPEEPLASIQSSKSCSSSTAPHEDIVCISPDGACPPMWAEDSPIAYLSL